MTLCEVPSAVVNMIEDESDDRRFCREVMRAGTFFEVPDVHLDSRFDTTGLTFAEKPIRFYAGVPLISRDGVIIGTFSVRDTTPRTLSAQQQQALQCLARQAIVQLELRFTNLSLERQTMFLEQQAQELRAASEQARRTERAAHEALECLRQSEEQFRSFSEHAVDSFYVHDFEGKILSVNNQACVGSGYSRDELLALSVFELESELSSVDLKAAWLTIVPGTHATVTGRHKRKDGTSFPVEVRSGPFIYDGQPCLLAIVRDTTERLRAESDHVAMEHAENANRAKSLFLSRMSHELRTPLNSVLGFAQLLEVYEPDDRQQECIGHILRGGRHLLGLINEVLDLSRIESGNMSLSLEPVGVSNVVEEAADLLRPLAAERHVCVTCKAGEPDLSAHADRQRLLQVTINLLSNAIKYNVEGGSVEMQCSRVGEHHVLLSVRDTGMGIPAHLSPRVFAPFDRLGAETNESAEGTGLGLALAKNLVEVMGGSIWYESVVNHGTTFYVRLPLSQPLASLAEVKEKVSGVPEMNCSRKVLYVEDNPSNVVLMRHIFASQPQWSLTIATTAGEGLSLARELFPDVILLDLDLPDFSGAEVLRTLRADRGFDEVQIIVVSADATTSRIENMLSAGAQDYLTKPFNVRGLVKMLGQLESPEASIAA